MPVMRNQIRKQGRSALVVLGAVAFSTVLGGCGIGFPLVELTLQLLLAALVVVWLWWSSLQRLTQISRATWLVAALIVALPLAQLVPLPPAIWHNLPGRAAELRSLSLIGLEQSWRPLSLVPDLTLACLLSMVSAIALLVMAGSVPRSGRTLVFGTLAAVALVSLVIGAGQVAGGDDNIFRFYQPRFSFLLGFQNNRNSQADVLLIGMICIAAVMRDMVLGGMLADKRRLVLFVVGGATALLVLGVVLTGSRTGMLLVLPVLLMQAVLLRPWLGLGWRKLGLLTLGGLIGGALAVYVLRDNVVIARSLGRFTTLQEFRPEIWTDTLFAIRSYLPWGTGMGTFMPVFVVHERLEIVSDLLVNRAHNDYLELALEAGVPGLVLLTLVSTLLFRGAVKGLLAQDRRVRGQVFCAVSVLAVIGMHSLLDYPLRSMSLAGIAAVCAAVLLNPLGASNKHVV